MFDPVSNKVDFPRMEEEVLAFWARHRTFEKSVAQRKGGPGFTFYDGPPFATGLPHYGHLLAGTIKDIVPRYWAMRGHEVPRRFGWDCHGLPIEALAQEALGLAGAGAIREAGVDVFNEQCRSMVLRYVEEWRQTVTRMGRWVDFDHDYKTMDRDFMETVWWVFKQLWDQGRIYRDYRIMPYSWKLNTPLSNFEAGSNYQEVQDPAITVRFRLREHGIPGDAPAYALAWTTTPWTLPGNLALCAGPDIAYVALRDRGTGDVYLLAEARAASYWKALTEETEEVARFTGRDLEGWTYEPLFPYAEDHAGAFRFFTGDFVTTEDGTGLVHVAPAYGEDDYRVCRERGIELFDYLDADCRFTARIPDFEGQFCKDADRGIIRRLKDEGRLVHQGVLVHSYPFCERTDTPLIYRAIDAWYVRVEDLRERMAAHNETIRWTPEAVGSKRFANWLRDARDWNISRNRFWGSCLPVWIRDDGGDMLCVGSIAELEALCGHPVEDLHKHTLDQVTFEKDGHTWRRTPEVLDCWFESGSMPYAQQHYPFENKDEFERRFPADFIAEGLDQTRGWFYTLTILATALFDRPAFRNVVVNGMVLAEDGRKMSKRLKNYPDPQHMLGTYGADTLRLYMISSPAVRGEDLRFSEAGAQQAMRHLLIPWWNAYAFFVTYARIDGWTPVSDDPGTPSHPLDRWILSRTEHLNQDVVATMDRYDLQGAVRPLLAFLDDLTNWYIRRSRRRFWKSRDDADKRDAYQTLHHVLLKLARIAAPFTPFISEAIHRNLRLPDMPGSVHLCDFPLPDGSLRDADLEAQMEDVLTVVGLGRALRTEHNLKVRQPLRRLHVACTDGVRRARIEAAADMIADELNVKEVVFSADDRAWASLRAKADFRKLGPRLGPKVKLLGPALAGLKEADLRRLDAGQPVTLDLDGDPLELSADEVILERTPHEGLAVAAEGALVAGLETDLDEALVREGLAREFISKVQAMRKDADLEVDARIRVTAEVPAEVAAALGDHGDLVCGEVLAEALEVTACPEADARAWDINGHPCRIRLRPVANG